MARTIRNQRLDSRTARAVLAIRHAPYWHALTRGRALGYRKGAKGGAWLAKYRTADGKREQVLLGPADDAFDSETSRSEEHTSELQSLMRISYAVFCLKKKKHQ